jgi:hypothetical protein
MIFFAGNEVGPRARLYDNKIIVPSIVWHLVKLFFVILNSIAIKRWMKR